MRVVTYRTENHEERTAIFTEEGWQVSRWNGREWEVLGGADEELLRALRKILGLGAFGESLTVDDIRQATVLALRQARDAFNADNRKFAQGFLRRAMA